MFLLAPERLADLLHTGSVRLPAFGGRLLCVVPITDASKVFNAVIVTPPNVVYIDGRF